MKFVYINFTNAIPRRVQLISSSISSHGVVDQICWKRFKNGNTDSEAQLIQANSSLIFLFKLLFKLAFRRYGVYVFDDMRAFPVLIFLSKLKGVKLIYNRQEIPHLTVVNFLQKFFKIPFKHSVPIAWGIESFFARRVDLILTIPLSKSGANELLALGCPVLSLLNVPDKIHFSKQYHSSTKKNAKERLLIYAGAVSPENGLVSYFRLLRRLNDDPQLPCIKLLLIGRHWRFSLNELKCLISKESCDGLVEYREWVSYDALTEILPTADIGLALSDPDFVKYSFMGDGSSRKVFTYMSAGLPVIAGGVFGRVIEEVHAGYFVGYNDIDAMFNAAKEILLDSNLSRSMGAEGMKSILNRYNWKRESSQIHLMISKHIL